MPTVKATFDGKVFVPCEPVQLPVGIQVRVVVPTRPRKPTAEDEQFWRELQQHLNATQPYFPTLEDAMRYTRKYP